MSDIFVHSPLARKLATDGFHLSIPFCVVKTDSTACATHQVFAAILFTFVLLFMAHVVIYACFEYTDSLLYKAAVLGDLNLTRSLLASGANPDIGRTYGPFGLAGSVTPLYAAVEKGVAVSVLNALLVSGARPDIGRRIGPFGAMHHSSPLFLAVKRLSTDAVAALLASGASPEGGRTGLPFGVSFTETPMLALTGAPGRRNGPSHNYETIVSALVKAGANPHNGVTKLLMYHTTPLQIFNSEIAEIRWLRSLPFRQRRTITKDYLDTCESVAHDAKAAIESHIPDTPKDWPGNDPEPYQWVNDVLNSQPVFGLLMLILCWLLFIYIPIVLIKVGYSFFEFGLRFARALGLKGC